MLLPHATTPEQPHAGDALPSVPRLISALATPRLAGKVPYTSLGRFWSNLTFAAHVLGEAWGADHAASGYTRTQLEEIKRLRALVEEKAHCILLYTVYCILVPVGHYL